MHSVHETGRSTVNNEPALKERGALPYAGVRLRLSRERLAQEVPSALGKLRRYFEEHGITPDATPLVRYLVVDYNTDDVEVDVGLPVTSSELPADPHVHYGQMPAGTFASLMHHGSYARLMETTKSLLDWAKQTNAKLHVAADDNVTWWAARVEHYLIGPPGEPDPDRWLTEVAILLAP